jgi:hypothetical protein
LASGARRLADTLSAVARRAGVLAAGLLFFFVFQVLLVYWWAPLKLGVALAAAFIPLAIHRRHAPVGSLLADLDGPVRLTDALIILIMPTVAVGVYALATAVQPSTDTIYLITTFGQVLGSAYAGAAAFLLAMVVTVRNGYADAADEDAD